MELTKIEIENYKSIKSPVTITFLNDLPTVLIGKNGSGKTNVLKALNAIASANSNYYANGEKEQPIYRAYIQLSEEDVAKILPDLVYDKKQCEIVAYNRGENLKIDRISSEYIIPSLKEKVVDIRELASQLKDAVDLYEKQLAKIAHNGDKELSIHCYKLKDKNCELTNYNKLHWQVGCFIDDLRRTIDSVLQHFQYDEADFDFVMRFSSGWGVAPPFQLEYVEPSLANFEQKFISINSTAIKREITKINKATKDTCNRIDLLITQIKDRIDQLQEEFNDSVWQQRKADEHYNSFLRRIKHIIGRKCAFLKNENNDVIFRKEKYAYDYPDHSNSILETYLRYVYQGSDREELLNSLPKELNLSEQAFKDFESFLNENIPLFDKGMYDSISVRAGKEEPISIFLNEKTGEQINLNETSAGRRWYFTYYFMKNILNEGDILIIDEPAAMLHPVAQREVLCDLMELTKRGVKVVYSTHSPYLIPDKWQCVHFVTMTEKGTEVNGVSSNQELVSQMTDIVGEDIFDVQDSIEKYLRCSPEKIAENISQLIRNTIEERNRDLKKAVDAIEYTERKATLRKVCDEMNIEYDTMVSWNKIPYKTNGEKNKKYSSPSLEHIMIVLKWANKKITDILD